MVLVNHMSWEYFNLVNSPNQRLGFTKDRLFMYCPAFFFSKKSTLKVVFNEELGKLRESGVIEHWIKKYVDGRKIKPIQAPIKLKIFNIFAAFEICIVMYFISFIIFILELLSVKYYRIKLFIETITY